MASRTALALLLLLAGQYLPTPAQAAESTPVASPRVIATLIADTDAVAPTTAFTAGLRLRIAPGWHVYWRNPGEAGQETVLTPLPPPGAVAGPVGWPAPAVFREGGITVYGFETELVLPVVITPGERSGTGFALAADASWLVCKTVCVPEDGHFTLDLPWGPPAPSADAGALHAPLPGPAPFAATVSPGGVLSLEGAGAIREAHFFPDVADTIVDGADQLLSAGPDRTTLRLQPGPAFDSLALTGLLTLRDDAGEHSVLVAPRPGAEPALPAPAASLLPTLVLAFLGGLLLNLMPCVFPVLAMKAAALARLSGAGRAAVRAEALSYTAGVLCTFGALGGALSWAGAGWGTQFQSPVFVAASAWVMFAVGLNLSGVWTVGAANAGSSLAGLRGHAGAFFTGALAVLVAAPCTAPFMGTAVAAALALPGLPALGVFVALGLGLAAPYLLLAAWPGAVRMLPRPGRWMDVLKGALAFPMYAASAWLVWVVATEAGTGGVLVAGSGLVLAGFAAWAWNLAAHSGRGGRWAGCGAAAGAVVLALLLLGRMEPGGAPGWAEAAEPFSAARLASLRAEGRPVFVDMTASWCLPCLLNERVALSPGRVRDAFAAHDVVVLRGDWTRKDPAITAFLRSQDRAGVPLYVFYPSGGAARVLPTVLTAGLVMDSIATH